MKGTVPVIRQGMIMKKISYRRGMIYCFLLTSIIFTGCKDKKTETKVEDSLKDISNTVNDKLKTIDKAADKNTKEYSEKIEDGAKVVGDKAENALKKVDKKANEVFGDEGSEK
jgi:hypothetical protein